MGRKESNQTNKKQSTVIACTRFIALIGGKDLKVDDDSYQTQIEQHAVGFAFNFLMRINGSSTIFIK